MVPSGAGMVSLSTSGSGFLLPGIRSIDGLFDSPILQPASVCVTAHTPSLPHPDSSFLSSSSSLGIPDLTLELLFPHGSQNTIMLKKNNRFLRGHC